MSRLTQADGSSPNTAIGIILLIALGVFAAPNPPPEFVSDFSPYLLVW